MSAPLPSAPFPEYGSCGNSSQSHHQPFICQPLPQSHLSHGHDHYNHHQHQYQAQQSQPIFSNMASAPTVYPPYPPPYSPYPGQPMVGPVPPAGPYPPQMAYPAQPGGGWYGQPQPQVVHVVEPARNDGCGCCGTCCASLLAACCLVECMEHCCHD